MDLKNVKIICRLILAIFLVFMMIMGITSNPVFGYLSIAIMAAYAIFHQLYWRCPNCNKNLGPLWIKCCPNCGEKIE